MEPINIFDFDGTLTNQTWPKFWVWIKKFGFCGEMRNEKLEKALAEYRKKNVGNELETFFGFFHDLLVQHGETITNEELMEGEKYIVYNPGLKEYIDDSLMDNYIVSGGLREFLQNLEIAKYFKGIYGTSVKYDEVGRVIGIGEVMTEDKKIEAIQDILKKNHRLENDCRNVYYIGDGYSDLVAMKFVHKFGGKAIFVQQPNQEDEFYLQNHKIYERLKAEELIDFVCIADYRKGSKLWNLLQRK